MWHQTPQGYKEPFEQMDGNSCNLGVVPNVHGADVCTPVPQSESDPTLSPSHISVASFNAELHSHRETLFSCSYTITPIHSSVTDCKDAPRET